MRRREILRPREAALHGVVHPDVFVEFLPAQGESLDAEFHFFEFNLGSFSQKRVFAGGKTDEPLVGQFEPDPAAFNPAAQRGDRR